jgi:hypothetical protein
MPIFELFDTISKSIFHVTSLYLHSFVISCTVMTNCARTLSIRVDEFIITRPHNGTHKEITLLHVPEPIEFHDPIITFKMFIFVINIGLHIIYNMSWVCKHVTQPSMMWSIPCSTIMNDILLINVYACENDHNLVFTHVPSQCPFACATKYFGEWEFHRISDVGKALAPYAPSSIILKGWLVDMGEWNKGRLFHTSCNNGLHNLVFYETLF